MPHWSGAAHGTLCAKAWLGQSDFVVCSKQQGVLMLCQASNLLPSELRACITSLPLWPQ